ncbi:hypothetical protein BG015_008895 [Linnemannia schmuckeri]|uniref:Mitochondrial carrier protein n=1 Tax=Linnemannia schmuckeri TaxID=64567 RepID=A0A9P5RYT0_9FUNG|nr:hypothetical protein BG015_008895 [Linnemannia schmuckeri]
MPSDASINLRTSAAAAFFARLLVHPLDNLKVSVQYSKSVPEGVVPRLEHLVSSPQKQLNTQHKKSWQDRSVALGRRSGASFAKDRILFCRGVYQGVSFALAFQVPALALFLSTYDGTKHALAHIADSENMSTFHIHHFETHLVSGLMAKMAGTTLWAPMNRIQSMAAHPAIPLTLKEAFRLAKQVCRSEGLSGLWSGYGATLSSLLPYTMLYFASYEQLKQMARWMVVEKAKDQGGSWSYLNALQKYWSVLGQADGVPVQADLSPGTFMMCITGAVVLSSFVCQTATAIRTLSWDRPLIATLDTEQSASLRRLHSLPNLLQSFHLQPSSLPLPPLSSLSPHSPTRFIPSSALSIAGAAGFKYHPAVPSQFKTLMSSTTTVASQALAGLPWQQSQHATLSTTSLHSLRSSITHQHHLASIPLKGHVLPVSAFPFMPASSFAGPSPAYTTPINNNSKVGHSAYYKPVHMMTMMTAPLKQANLNMPGFNDNELTRKISNMTSAVTTRSNNSSSIISGTTPGLLRTIIRGLGPRIMWTIPGVTLTTAGFEVLRNLAS